MMYGWIIGLVLVIILFVAINRTGVFKRKTNKNFSQTNRTAKTPLEVLETRYAKGEIDKEEFEKRKTDLEKTK